MFPFTNTHPDYSPYLHSSYHHPQGHSPPMYQNYSPFVRNVVRDQHRHFVQQHHPAQREHISRRAQYLPDEVYDYPEYADGGVSDDQDYDGYYDSYGPQQALREAEVARQQAMRDRDRALQQAAIDRQQAALHREQAMIDRDLALRDAQQAIRNAHHISDDDYDEYDRGRSMQDDDFSYRRVRPSKSRESVRSHRASSRPAPPRDRPYDAAAPMSRSASSRPSTPAQSMRRSVSRQSFRSPSPPPREYLHPHFNEQEQERPQRPRSRSRPREPFRNAYQSVASPYLGHHDSTRFQSHLSPRQFANDSTHSGPSRTPQVRPSRPSPSTSTLPVHPDTTLGTKEQGQDDLHAASEDDEFDEATRNQIRAAAKTISNYQSEFKRMRNEFITPRELDYQAPGGENAGAEPGSAGAITIQVPRELSDFHSFSSSGVQSQIADEDANTSSATKAKPRLAYTSRNFDIHAYMEGLNKLLIKLDGVESWGSREVRESRRRVVKNVEEEARKLEEWIGKVWLVSQHVQRHGQSPSQSHELEHGGIDNGMELSSFQSPRTRVRSQSRSRARTPGPSHSPNAYTMCVDSNLDSDTPLTNDHDTSSHPLSLPVSPTSVPASVSTSIPASSLDRPQHLHAEEVKSGLRSQELRDMETTQKTKDTDTDTDMGVVGSMEVGTAQARDIHMDSTDQDRSVAVVVGTMDTDMPFKAQDKGKGKGKAMDTDLGEDTQTTSTTGGEDTGRVAEGESESIDGIRVQVLNLPVEDDEYEDLAEAAELMEVEAALKGLSERYKTGAPDTGNHPTIRTLASTEENEREVETNPFKDHRLGRRPRAGSESGSMTASDGEYDFAVIGEDEDMSVDPSPYSFSSPEAQTPRGPEKAAMHQMSRVRCKMYT